MAQTTPRFLEHDEVDAISLLLTGQIKHLPDFLDVHHFEKIKKKMGNAPFHFKAIANDTTSTRWSILKHEEEKGFVAIMGAGSKDEVLALLGHLSIQHAYRTTVNNLHDSLQE